MPPFLIAGAVFILLKVSGTLQRFVYEELQGVKDVRATRDWLRRKRFDDPEKERARIDALRGLEFITGIWDIAITNSYDPTTNEGRIEMAADLGALGFKLGALKLGLPIVGRVVGALGTRFVVAEGLSLATGLGSIIDVFSGKAAGQTFGEIGDAIKSANELINQGKRAGDAFLPLVEEGTSLAFDSVDVAIKAGAFATAPSIVGGVSLAVEAAKLVEGFLRFFGLVQELVPEVEEELKPFERFGPLPLDPGLRARAPQELPPSAVPAGEPFGGPMPVGGPGVAPGILAPPVVGVPPPPLPRPIGLFPPGAVPPGATPVEFAQTVPRALLGGSRIGISDLLRIVAELKKG